MFKKSYFCCEKKFLMFLRRLFLFFVMAIGLTLFSCNPDSENEQEKISSDLVNNPNTASGKSDQSILPVFQFEETEHNFGKILEGETVAYNFKFKNIGKSDMIITEVSTSCGCTVPSFSKTPIPPGKEGVIRIAFNSQGRRGFQSKNILVVANTQPNTTVLHIKAQVTVAGGQK